MSRTGIALKKNQVIPLEITGITQDGNGVGRWEGAVVFVPMTAPGDRLLAKVVKVSKTHAFAVIEELTAPASAREESACSVYKRCGGCGLRHLSYDEEIRLKDGWVRENLRRIGHVEPDFDPPLPSSRHDRYRNKAQYPVRRINGKIRTGFFARRSHSLIPVEDCLLQPRSFSDLSRCLCDFMEEFDVEPYREEDHTGLVRTLYLRRGEAAGQVMVCVVINGSGIPEEDELVRRLLLACPDIATILVSVNRRRDNVILGDRERVLYGNGIIRDILCGVEVELSPRSFYQVNRESAEALYKKALEYADPSPEDILLDLYCGTGTIGLSMAERVKRLIGVETVPEAVEDAIRNARRGNIQNAEFFCADASGAVPELRGRGLRPDIIILDPPRKGASPEVLSAMAEMSPDKIVYISCDSATLARDIARLSELGYRAVRAGTVDLFPRTCHVECVVLMTSVTSVTLDPIRGVAF